jgi:hypothetical protein
MDKDSKNVESEKGKGKLPQEIFGSGPVHRPSSYSRVQNSISLEDESPKVDLT